MASVEELKEMIIDLRMDLIRANIPYEHWPYAYSSTSKHEGRRNCDDISCSECKRKFFEDNENDIRQEVNQL